MAMVHPVHYKLATMASPKFGGTAPVSKLQLMQARFQQKQQQEKERKLWELCLDQGQQNYGRLLVNNNNNNNNTRNGGDIEGHYSQGGGGRVRQLFKERHRGLDRSYPLLPLADQYRPNQTQPRRGVSLDRAPAEYEQDLRGPRYPARPPTYQRYPSAGYDHCDNGRTNVSDDDDYYYYRRHQQPPTYAHPDDEEDYTIVNHCYRPSKEDQKPKIKNSYIFGENENDYPRKSTANVHADSPPTKIFNKLPNIGGGRESSGVDTDRQKLNKMAPAKEKDPIRKSALPVPNNLTTKISKSEDPSVKTITKSLTKLTTTAAKKPEIKPVQNSNYTKTKLGVRRSITPAQPLVSNLNQQRPATSRPTSSSSTMEKEKQKSSEKVSTTSTKKVPSNPRMLAKSSPRQVPSAPSLDLIPCNVCGRKFAADRIEAHQVICSKTGQKKRKPFDPVKQRLIGTGAEKYLGKGNKAPPPPTTPKKSNWRKKHEEFINNIRAAKQAQAHVAAGGKLSDLPPPPPLDTSDYVQCPHCGRKFNEAAAERHIPKCANMMHNKPKPGGSTSNAAGSSRMQAAKKKYR